jgi:hypothetical protein
MHQTAGFAPFESLLSALPEGSMYVLQIFEEIAVSVSQTCKALLNSISVIPFRGPLSKSRIIEGLTMLTRA